MERPAFPLAARLFDNADSIGTVGHFQELIQISSTAEEKAGFLLDLANCYAEMGRVDDAGRCFEEAGCLAATDSRKLLLIEIGKACLALDCGRSEEALAALNRLLIEFRPLFELNNEYRPLQFELELQRGVLFVRLARYQDAIDAFTVLHSVCPVGEVSWHLAHCHQQLKENRIAEEYFAHATEDGVEDSWAGAFHYARGCNYCELGNIAAARREFEHCAQYGSEGLMASDVQGMLAAACGHLTESEPAVRFAALGQS